MNSKESHFVSWCIASTGTPSARVSVDRAPAKWKGPALGNAGLALAVALVAMMGLPGPRTAFASGVVTNATEANLRAALAGGGTVTFATSGTIALVDTLTIETNTVLDASGHSITLSGNRDYPYDVGHLTRVFNVRTGVTFAVVNLTIADGYADAGAGLLNEGGTVHLVGVTFSNHWATGPLSFPPVWGGPTCSGTPQGGAVCSFGGVVNATNCTFRSNRAIGYDCHSALSAYGGGLFLSGGEVNLDHCVFAANNAFGESASCIRSGGGGFGGAVFSTGRLRVRACAFTDNVAGGNKGGQSNDSNSPCSGGAGGLGQGGAICSQQELWIESSTFARNTASGGNGGNGTPSSSMYPNGYPGGAGGAAQGGAICSLTNTVVVGCTFDSNAATAGAGGTGSDGRPDYSVVGGREGFAADGGGGGIAWGGGLCVLTGAVQVINCTFAFNTVLGNNGNNGGNGVGCGYLSPRASAGNGGNGGDGLGAGLFVQHPNGTVVNCTFVGNAVFSGVGGQGGTPCCGRYNWCGTYGVTGAVGVASGGAITTGATNGAGLRVLNSILAYSTGGSNCHGAMFDLGYNLNTDASGNFTSPGSRVGVNPSLGPLANNGGPTATFALLPNSPLIDAGSCDDAPTVDQRGVARPAGVACDIGAYEYDRALVPLSLVGTASPPSIPVGGVATLNLTLANSNDVPARAVSLELEWPSQVTVAADPGLGATCTGAVMTAVPGQSRVSASGLVLGAQQECVLQVNVASLEPGLWRPTRLVLSDPDYGTRDDAQTLSLRVITPPVITPLLPSDPASNSVTLRALVNPRGAATSGFFEWGLTPALGSVTPAQALGNGFTNVTLATPRTGLTPNTVFYYRAVAANVQGSVTGEVRQAFTTGGAVVVCREDNLRASLAEGGHVRFACDGVLVVSNTVTITNDVVLDATGHDVTISGHGTVRVFQVNAGAHFTLINATVANGRCTNGGGLWNGGTVHLLRSRFVGNEAVGLAGVAGTNGLDGALNTYPLPGTSGTPGGPGSDGTGSFGGGVFNAGVLTILDSAFLSNRVVGGSGGPGGTGGGSGYGRPTVSGGAGGHGGAASGGAVFNAQAAAMTVTNSLFACSVAEGGTGGLGGNGGPVVAYGVSPGGVGGAGGQSSGAALCNWGSATFLNVTFAANHTQGGSGGFAGLPRSDYQQGSCPGSASGNGGEASGGALDNFHFVYLKNCTLWGNTALGGSGTNQCPSSPPGTNGTVRGSSLCAETGSSTTLRSTIVGYGSSLSNGWGQVTDGGHNLASDGSLALTSPDSMEYVDPLLGPLADNGGPTLTMAPAPESLAIDGGDPATCPSTDQRGVARPVGAACDIGAVEGGVVFRSPVVFATFSPSLIATGGVASLRITVSNPNPYRVPGILLSDDWPVQLSVVSPTNLSNLCGSVDLILSNRSLIVSGIDLGSNLVCTMELNFTSPTAGLYTNTVKTISADQTSFSSGTLVVASPPFPVAGGVTQSTTNGEMLTGFVNPNGRETLVYFEYGATTNYGSRTVAARAGHESSPVMVAIQLDGAVASTGCHYRLVAVNGLGTSFSNDQLFSPASPVAGTALSFDGVDDYVATSDLTPFFSNETIAVEFWFRAEAAGVLLMELGQPPLVSGWKNSQLEVLSSGEVKARIWELPPFSLGYAGLRAWTHVALRYDKTARRGDGFLNGVPSATRVSGDRRAPWEFGYQQYFVFGLNDAADLGSGAWFKGQIDEVRVWNTAPTDSEIREYMNRRLTGLEAGLVFYWRLDDGDGTRAGDGSIHGNHGVLNNGPAWVMSAVPFAATASATLLQNGFVRISFFAEPGTMCALRASSNLVDWTSLLTKEADTNGLLQWLVSPASRPMRFYKVTLP
ncbi:MAG: LamG domain-containing protein [Verrucomicrobia bacterium]|nr:LamG domain-containing protein [Verrucomicrobiota bacterium]